MRERFRDFYLLPNAQISVCPARGRQLGWIVHSRFISRYSHPRQLKTFCSSPNWKPWETRSTSNVNRGDFQCSAPFAVLYYVSSPLPHCLPCDRNAIIRDFMGRTVQPGSEPGRCPGLVVAGAGCQNTEVVYNIEFQLLVETLRAMPSSLAHLFRSSASTEEGFSTRGPS